MSTGQGQPNLVINQCNVITVEDGGTDGEIVPPLWEMRLEEFEQGRISSSKNGARPKSAKQKLEFGEILLKKGIKIEVEEWELIARANP